MAAHGSGRAADGASRVAKAAMSSATASAAKDARAFTGRSTYRDLDEFRHCVAPPRYEMTLTGPESGPWTTSFLRFERGVLHFGTEGGPNVGHAHIPDWMVGFHLPLSGPAPISAGTLLGRTRIAVFGPGSDQIEAVRGPARWATFSVAPDVIDAARARRGIATPAFEPGSGFVVAVTRRDAQRVRALLADVERRLDGTPREFDDPDVRAATLRALAECFVTAVTCGRRARPRAGAAAEDHARILLDVMRYLGATQEHAVTLQELCTAAGTSQRTLRRAFDEAFDVSPARYLRLRRLSQVRAWIRRGSPAPATVTEAATRFGFFELGRFAGEYRRLFGELPSDAFRKRTV